MEHAHVLRAKLQNLVHHTSSSVASNEIPSFEWDANSYMALLVYAGEECKGHVVQGYRDKSFNLSVFEKSENNMKSNSYNMVAL
ncbi:hypothetical protein PM082_009528 [Marasmius tenuissimus]|nr:hypothetical protein PM082_009528 [Marasmius tenuissimus]